MTERRRIQLPTNESGEIMLEQPPGIYHNEIGSVFRAFQNDSGVRAVLYEPDGLVNIGHKLGMELTPVYGIIRDPNGEITSKHGLKPIVTYEPGINGLEIETAHSVITNLPGFGVSYGTNPITRSSLEEFIKRREEAQNSQKPVVKNDLGLKAA